MNWLPFLLVALLNGVLVGLIAGVVARALARGDGGLRFRDSAALGMVGALAGGTVATLINATDGYLATGPSSLFYSFGGAGIALVGFRAARQRV